MSTSRLQQALGGLVLLTLAVAPVKYLAFDVGGADITGFRLAVLAAFIVAVALAATDAAYRSSVLRLVRTRFFLAATAFAAWICVSGVHGLLTAPTATLERRAVIGTGSLVLTALILPLVAVPALVRLRDEGRALRVAAGIWQALVAYAFVQVALHLVGVPVNGIEPGIPSAYPEAPLFGLDLLRPYSVVGEPRDLASMVIPLLVAGVVLAGKERLTLRHGLVLGGLGVLLASYTFYLALFAFAAYYLLFERRSRLIEWKAAAVAVALVVAVPLVSAAVNPDGTRVLKEFDDITAPREPTPANPEAPGDGGSAPEPEPEPVRPAPGTGAYNQAPDLLAADYAEDAVTGEVGAADLVFGNGIGSFTTTVNRYYIEQFDYDLVRNGQLVNSRLLPFGLLVEGGLLALALLAWLAMEAVREVQRSGFSPRQRSRIRTLAGGFVLASLVQTSILFGVGLVLALVLAWRREADGEEA